MSAIQKKPYIRNVLDSMEDEEKVTLLQLVDGKQNKPTPKSLINPSQHITGADKLLTPEYIALETKEGVYTGYLIYNDDYCTLIAYEDGSQNLDILDIDLSNMTYSVNKENTSIADMRFEIEQSKEKMDVVAYIEEAIQEGDIAIDADIVTISATGVQSDEIAAKILAAKAVYYSGRLYMRSEEDTNEISFWCQTQAGSADTRLNVIYTKATKSVSTTQSEYKRVTTLGGNNGTIGLDDSMKSLYSPTRIGLSGKLPYLDTLPTADNTSGFLTIVKCTSEPAAADRREGYLYIVVPSAQ